MKIKKLAAVLFSALMMFSMAACSAVTIDGEGGSGKDQDAAAANSSSTGSGSVGMSVSTLNNLFL